MPARSRGGAVVMLAAGVVAVVLLATPRVDRAAVLVEDPSEFYTAEKEYAVSHPVYTRCKAKVDMPEFVKDIRKTCGDVHELATVNGPCKSMLDAKSTEFGCCWESVMKAYDLLDPQAAHKWRLWQGTVSGKGGVVFHSADCGESMGEKSYSDLKGEVASLKTVVSEQQSEISDVMNVLFGYGGNSGYYGPPYDPSYDPYAGSYYYNYYDPLTGAYFKDDKKGSAALKARGIKPGPPKRYAPEPPLGSVTKHSLQAKLKTPRSAQISWWQNYWNPYQAAVREHYRAAEIHHAAANSAIYAAYAHANNANAYGEQYNELIDKALELEKHRYATSAAERTADAAANFAAAAQKDAERHSAAAKLAAEAATTAVSVMSSGAPLLPMSDTVAPVGGTAAFFTQNDPADKGVQKLQSDGVNVGF